RLHGPELGLPKQEDVPRNGYAIQCRITTEDPANNFTPNYGKLITYRSAAGFGVRLDTGMGTTGSVITPFYDSLLTKVTTWGPTFPAALRRMTRCLHEFRIRGVKTNIPFLDNVISHPVFQAGAAATTFIDTTPE
ncbi:MAG: acetyl-CoA carboxylase biotin carboxylase subunit, partial [Terrimicrobiaceae bacterium]|nr:acetyl-CoA carboxylase biotin carboxylase subunit [Terrimicrobiaceae bacterium]